MQQFCNTPSFDPGSKGVSDFMESSDLSNTHQQDDFIVKKEVGNSDNRGNNQFKRD